MNAETFILEEDIAQPQNGHTIFLSYPVTVLYVASVELQRREIHYVRHWDYR